MIKFNVKTTNLHLTKLLTYTAVKKTHVLLNPTQTLGCQSCHVITNANIDWLLTFGQSFKKINKNLSMH